MDVGFPTINYGDSGDRRDIDDYLRDMRDVEKAPPPERKEAQAAYLAVLRDDPDLLGERVGWLLNGSFGRGSYLKAHEVLASPRMNRVAALSQMTAVLEWRCPAVMARQAWGKLTPAQQAEANKYVTLKINQYAEESGFGFPFLKGG